MKLKMHHSEDHPLSCLCLLVTIVTLIPSKVMGRCFYLFDSRLQTSGNFSSPGWPASYTSGTRCTYVFQGETFQAVKIIFHSFQLEEPYKAGCLADYLDVTTLDVTGVREFVGRYCGREIMSPILTLHPNLEIFFTSNLAINAGGFNASYTFVNEESIHPSPTMSRGQRVCGGLVEGKGGQVISPGYPKSFPAGLSCTWLLRARPHHHIYLRVQQLQLQGSIANCRRAELGIHDGYKSLETSSQSLKTFCGDLDYYRNQAEKVFLSQRNRLVITFRTGEPSDNTTSRAGFLLVWTEVSLTSKDNCSVPGRFLCRHSVYCVGVFQGGGCINTAHFCIDFSLACDGQPNCSTGDNSDEEECGEMLMLLAAIAVGIGAVLLAISGSAVLWLRSRRRPVAPSHAMNSMAVSAQTLVTTPSSCTSNNSINITRSDHIAEISWVEVPVPPPPPPPPFFASPLTSKHPPPIASNYPLSRRTQSLKFHTPFPPPNSPATFPIADLKSTMFHPKSERVKNESPSKILSSQEILPDLPSPYCMPSEIKPSQSPSPDCPSPPATSSSPLPPSPSPQSPTHSPIKVNHRYPVQEVLLNSPPLIRSSSTPAFAWPILSPPPTPPPPPISNPMQLAWLAAIKAPPTYSRKRQSRDAEFQRDYQDVSENEDKQNTKFMDENKITSSDTGSSKSHGSDSINIDSTKHHIHRKLPVLQDHKHSCRRRSFHKHNQCTSKHQNHHSCHHRSAGCILQLQNHNSTKSPNLVRSRSLPRHRTRIQPSPYMNDTQPWPLTPDSKKRKACFGGWSEENLGKTSPEVSACFPCVSNKLRTISKPNVNITQKDVLLRPDKRDISYHTTHMCRHHPHHPNHHCRCCHRNRNREGRKSLTFELRS